jgi:pSer/pThr/pTyr-binding forkhead associated (FHA) protein
MDVKLVVKSGPAKTRSLHVHAPVVLIGRQRGCGVRIASREVSRRHCLLRLRDGCVTVEDLASSNGTRLNGVLVSRAEVVRPGDRLEVGPITFLVEYALSPRALTRLLEEKAESGELKGSDLLEAIQSVEQVLEVIEDLPLVEALENDEAPAEEDIGTAPQRPPQQPSTRAARPRKGPPTPKSPEPEGPEPDEDVPGEPMETGAWSLPESGDLRDLLSGLDEPKAAPSKRAEQRPPKSSPARKPGPKPGSEPGRRRKGEEADQ